MQRVLNVLKFNYRNDRFGLVSVLHERYIKSVSTACFVKCVALTLDPIHDSRRDTKIHLDIIAF